MYRCHIFQDKSFNCCHFQSKRFCLLSFFKPNVWIAAIFHVKGLHSCHLLWQMLTFLSYLTIFQAKCLDGCHFLSKRFQLLQRRAPASDRSMQLWMGDDGSNPLISHDSVRRAFAVFGLSKTRNGGDIMKQYLELMRHVKDHGVLKEDRTGTGTRSVFGYQMRFDLSQGFPALTTKKLHLRSIIHELLWFLMGETNIRYLKEKPSMLP